MDVRDRRILGWAGAALCVVGLFAGVGYWWLVLRWQPPPSIFDDPVDDVAGYLALDDFSALSMEERVRFLMGFSDRFRGLDQSESAVLAGFLAGLSGPARQQLIDNAKTLAKDILADGARRYLALETDEERAAFLDDWLVEWVRTGERMSRGEERDRTDDQRLSSIKEDGRTESQRRPDRPISLGEEGAMAFMDFWQSEVESTASPKEQGQIIRFMTELRDHVATPGS